MSPSTHCTSIYASPPTIPTWAQPVPPVADGVISVVSDPGATHRRGVIVFCHQSSGGNAAHTPQDLPMPPVVPSGIGQGVGGVNGFGDQLKTNGWVTIYPGMWCDWSSQGIGYPQAFATQANSDGTKGTTVFETQALWFDHLKWYLNQKYGVTVPIIIAGFSLGAWVAASIALQKFTDPQLVGYICHALPTIWENVVIPGSPFTSPPYTGVNLSATSFSAAGVSIPGVIGWATTDGFVGYSSSSTPVSNVASILSNAATAGLPLTSYESLYDELAAYPNGHLLAPGIVTSTPITDCQFYAGWVGTNLNPSHLPFF